MNKKVIRFQAQVSQVRTLADGGIRLILDLPESAIDTATKMMETKQAGATLEIAAIPVKAIKYNGNDWDGFVMADTFPGIHIERVK
jgi:hypothetical protein